MSFFSVVVFLSLSLFFSGLSQQLACSGLTGPTASHAGADAKTEVAFKYTLPANAADGAKIASQFSVVKDYNNYWVKEAGSQKLTVKGAAAEVRLLKIIRLRCAHVIMF